MENETFAAHDRAREHAIASARQQLLAFQQQPVATKKANELTVDEAVDAIEMLAKIEAILEPHLLNVTAFAAIGEILAAKLFFRKVVKKKQEATQHE